MSNEYTYTEQEDAWLKANATGRDWLSVTEQFNKTFNAQKSENALKMHFAYLKKHKKATVDVECCKNCGHAYKGGTCPMYKTCASWRKWFKNEWRIIRALAGKEN